MKRWIRLTAWLIPAALFVHACEGKVATDSTSGNTNWLKLCDKPADCGEGLSCLCNTCHQVCTDSTDCTLVAPGSRCEGPGETMQCGDAPVAIRLCVDPQAFLFPDASSDADLPDVQLPPVVETDAAALRLCTDDPLMQVDWPCGDTATCDGDLIPSSSDCPFGWACTEYDTARARLIADCASIGNSTITAAQGCGFRVLEKGLGSGAPTRAFYDEDSGELVGTWFQSETPSEETCSGSVPRPCLDYEGLSLTETVNLCQGTENLLDNGDFVLIDMFGFAEDWTRHGTPATAIVIDHGEAQPDGSSVKMVMPESYEYWIEQTVSTQGLTAGDRLQVTGYYRVDRANADIEIAVNLDDDFLHLETPATANTWIPFSVEAFTPNSASFRILFWATGPQSEPEVTLWFDSLRLERVPQ